MSNPEASTYYQPELPFGSDVTQLQPFEVILSSVDSVPTTPILIEPLDYIRARGPEYAMQYAHNIVGMYKGRPKPDQIPATMTSDEAARYLKIDVLQLNSLLPLGDGLTMWPTYKVLAYKLDPRTRFLKAA